MSTVPKIKVFTANDPHTLEEFVNKFLAKVRPDDLVSLKTTLGPNPRFVVTVVYYQR